MHNYLSRACRFNDFRTLHFFCLAERALCFSPLAGLSSTEAVRRCTSTSSKADPIPMVYSLLLLPLPTPFFLCAARQSGVIASERRRTRRRRRNERRFSALQSRRAFATYIREEETPPRKRETKRAREREKRRLLITPHQILLGIARNCP